MARQGVIFFNDAVAGTKVEVGATGQKRINNVRLVNATAAVAYLQVFFLPAASVTVGTTTPDFCFRLGSTESFALNLDPHPLGKPDSVGLTLAGCTTATGSTGAAISTLLGYS